MSRKKELYRVGDPVIDPKRHKKPYWCKWYELVSDKSGSREIPKSKWFPALKDAEAYGKLVSGNRAVRELTDQERLIALHIFQECEARGLTPLEVHSAGLKYFGRERVKECEMNEAVELFCIWMTGEDYSAQTIQGYEGSLKWLIRQTDGNRLVSSYSALELITLVKGRYENHVSRKAFMRDLKSFFSWASRQNFCSKDISAQTLLDSHKTKSSVRKSALRRSYARPPRLRADQIKTMFEAVDPRYHAALALAVFAGIRPQSELPNIEWTLNENGHTYGIDFEHKRINLPDHWVQKTYMSRQLTDLPDPLWRILEKHRQESGKVCPCNYANIRKSILTKAKEALGTDRWPTDYLRHTALSFQAAISGREIAMNNAGHLNTRTFTRHYLNSVGSEEAAEFNALFPNYPNLD